MYLMLDGCIGIGWMYLILEVLCVSRHFEAGLEIHNWSWQGLFVCPSSCQILCKGGGNLNMLRFTKPTISWLKYQNCCFGFVGYSTCRVSCICWQLQKSDKGQIYYWSSQTALGSGGCLVVVWLSPCSKTWKLPQFQTPSFWHPITFCPHCLILT